MKKVAQISQQIIEAKSNSFSINNSFKSLPSNVNIIEIPDYEEEGKENNNISNSKALNKFE